MDDMWVYQCDKCGRVIEAYNLGQLKEKKESHRESHYLESQKTALIEGNNYE